MDKTTAAKRIDELHTKLLEDVLYTELVNEGRGFVEHNMYLIQQESGPDWDENVAEQRVKLLEATALIPPSFHDDGQSV